MALPIVWAGNYSRFSLFANMRIISTIIREYSRIMRIILKNSQKCQKVQKLLEGNAKKSLITTVRAHFEQNLAKSTHFFGKTIIFNFFEMRLIKLGKVT